MRGVKKLTPLEIRSLTAPGLYADGNNLYLQIAKGGSKSWIVRFMRNGRARKMGLGSIHVVSLAEARKRAAEAKLAILDGSDPIDIKQQKKAAEKISAAKAMTFLQAAEAYIAANQDAWRNEKHRAQWDATFNETRRGSLVFPAITERINALPVSGIDTGLVLSVLEPIWNTKPETASRVRGRIETVLDWATVRGLRSGENPARWRGHLENVLPSTRKVKASSHHQAMKYSALPEFVKDLRTRSSISALALEFTILTAARTGEVIGARWDEIDLAEKVWTVPADRMKAGRAHRVPLCERAIAILEKLSATRAGDFIFTGHREGRPLSNMAMLELLRGMEDGLTVHGFRSTFRDWAAETTGHPNHVVEMALAHTIGDKVEAAYRRGDLFEKRRALMQDWASYCGEHVEMSARAR